MQSLMIRSAARALARDTRMVACMSFSTSNPLGSKEKGDEKQFFNKEDEKVLKDLLKKMQAQAKKAEAPENNEKSATALKKLFKSHKLSETDHKAFFDALLEWKKQ